jgi:hypothetical protein
MPRQFQLDFIRHPHCEILFAQKFNRLHSIYILFYGEIIRSTSDVLNVKFFKINVNKRVYNESNNKR